MDWTFFWRIIGQALIGVIVLAFCIIVLRAAISASVEKRKKD